MVPPSAEHPCAAAKRSPPAADRARYVPGQDSRDYISAGQARATTTPGAFAITQSGTISLGADGELTNELANTLRLILAPAPT